MSFKTARFLRKRIWICSFCKIKPNLTKTLFRVLDYEKMEELCS